MTFEAPATPSALADGLDTRPGAGARRVRPWVAFLLGLLAPGLGQIYAGHVGRGITAFLVFVTMVIPAVMLTVASLTDSYLRLVVVSTTFWIVFLALPVDAWMIARSQPRTDRSAWNRAWVYVGAVLVFASSLVLGSAAFRLLSPWRVYRIPANGMAPAIVAGDYVSVDTRRAALRSLVRGDVVAYEIPGRPGVLSVLRIVALPGELVEVRGGEVYVDSKRLEEPYVLHERDYPREAWLRILDGASPETLLLPLEPTSRDPRPPGLEYGPVHLPEGYWVLLGDNRDNANDSRSFGAVTTDAIRGKVLGIVTSISPQTGRPRPARVGPPGGPR